MLNNKTEGPFERGYAEGYYEAVNWRLSATWDHLEQTTDDMPTADIAEYCLGFWTGYTVAQKRGR